MNNTIRYFMNETIQELRDFLNGKGFEERYIECADNYSFRNKNLEIYFRKEFNEWRLKDRSVFSSLDITTINFPINEYESNRLWKTFSHYYKS